MYVTAYNQEIGAESCNKKAAFTGWMNQKCTTEWALSARLFASSDPVSKQTAESLMQ